MKWFVKIYKHWNVYKTDDGYEISCGGSIYHFKNKSLVEVENEIEKLGNCWVGEV